MAFGKPPAPAEQGKAIASPNGTASVEVGRRGLVESKVVIKNRGVSTRTEVTYKNIEIEDPGPIHATLDGGNRVLQSIEYQSVETSVRVSLPVKADAKAIKDGWKKVWAIVDEELQDRAHYAAETIKALVLMKRESEGKR